MRTFFSRFLLVALIAVAVFAIVHRLDGSSDAPVEITGIDVETLRHRAFRLREPARLAIDAVGSFEEAGGRADTVLAAYGWIVRRADGRVVWRMRPGARPARGTLAAVIDTLALPAGTYDAYFASYGDPLVRTAPQGTRLRDRLRATLSRGGRSWHGEAVRWQFLASGVSEADRAVTVRLNDDPHNAEPGPTEVWRSGALRNRQSAEAILRVSAPTRVRIRATGEAAGGDVRDGGSLIRMADQDTVWAFAEEGSTWAGGSVQNRRVEATVLLQPGLYRVAAHTDDAHAFEGWTANPPFAPWQWGLTVHSDSAGAPVALFDPAAADLPAIAGFDCVGPNEDLQEVLTFAQRTTVVMAATGEISGSSVYDAAFLYAGSEPSDDGLLWALADASPTHAGGEDKNRRAVGVLSLDPGTYLLRYTSDGSFDCEDGFAGNDGPDDGVWGVTLYAADPAFDPTTVTRDTGKGVAVADAAAGGEAPPDEPARQLLASIERVADDESREVSFELAAPTTVRILALGEMLPSSRLDYGWIEDEAGETVWQMTRSDSRPAGGDPKNRRFDGTVELGAGRYTVRYVTNGRHAYGSFEGRPPDNPEQWGIRVFAE